VPNALELAVEVLAREERRGHDVRPATSAAKRAAGDVNVLVHGARTAHLALAAGVFERSIHPGSCRGV